MCLFKKCIPVLILSLFFDNLMHILCGCDSITCVMSFSLLVPSTFQSILFNKHFPHPWLLCFVLRYIEFNYGYLCNNGFGVILRNLQTNFHTDWTNLHSHPCGISVPFIHILTKNLIIILTLVKWTTMYLFYFSMMIRHIEDFFHICIVYEYFFLSEIPI